MTAKEPKGLSASVRQRLLDRAKSSGKPFNEVLQYYAMERFLYRMSLSPYRSSFVLKGALLLHVWQGETARSTMDIDVLGHGPNAIGPVGDRIREIVRQEVPPDGIVFDPESVQAEAIAPDAEYQGVRVRFRGLLGKMRLAVQVDVGFGDALVPEPASINYPTLLDQPSPHLLAYTPESLVAEKLQAMVRLGAANSRMKDFYDLYTLGRTMPFEGGPLSRAIGATFQRRETSFPKAVPLALSPDFADLPQKGVQWKAFLKNNRLAAPQALGEIVATLAEFLWPPLESQGRGSAFEMKWAPGGPWKGP